MEKEKESTIKSKITKDIIELVKQEFNKHQQSIYEDLLNPVIGYCLEQINFEFKMYLVMAGIGLLILVVLFIINILFIGWLVKKNNLLLELKN